MARLQNQVVGQSGIAATLAGVGNDASDLGKIEKSILEWPIPPGFAVTFDRKPQQFHVQKGRAGFGLKIIRTTAGLFVANVQKESPAVAQKIVRGMHIVTINGNDARNLSEDQANVLASQSRTLSLRLQYDPVSYCAYDFGEELRRISLYAFQGEWSDISVVQDGKAKYLGRKELTGSPPPTAAVNKAFLSIKNGPRAGYNISLETFIGNSAFIARHTDKSETQREVHFFLDIFTVNHKENYVTIVSNDIVAKNTKRSPSCHVYEFLDEKIAQRVVANIVAKLTSGFDRVHQAVNETTTPEVLQEAQEDMNESLQGPMKIHSPQKRMVSVKRQGKIQQVEALEL